MTSSTVAPKKPGPRQAHNDKFHNYKVCSACGEEKRLADFALQGDWRKKRAADPKRYRIKCKKCCRTPSATRVDSNFKPDRKPRVMGSTPAEKREYANSYKRKKRRATRVKVLEYLAGKGCCECKSRDPRILEFDHIEPRDKQHNISRLLSDGYDWGNEKLRAEIRKCRVICANCHRKHTVGQQEYYSHADVRAALSEIYGRYGITE